MSEPRAPLPAPETLRAATRLERHLVWAEGFWLGYVFSTTPIQVHILQARLAARGREQRVIRPSTPRELERVLATIFERPELACVWVEAIREREFAQGAWTKAWVNCISRTNERRELLREKLSGGLVFVAHPAMKAELRSAGPDLWSIRTMVFELPSGPSPGVDMSGTDMQPAARIVQTRRRQYVDEELLEQDLERWAELVDERSPEVQARTFMQLAARLRDGDREEEAARASAAAIERYRELAAIQPAQYRPRLAESLGDLARDLAKLNLWDEALEVALEAADMYRALALEAPDDLTLRLGLAHALRDLGNCWSALGKREEALGALEEAVALYRRSSETRGLAIGLSSLGTELLTLGRPDDAFDVIGEADELLRRLVESDPDDFLPILAGNCSNLGMSLKAMGRREEALAAANEAVAIDRQLAEVQAR